MNEDSFFSNPENEELRKYIAMLPQRDQAVLYLYYFCGLGTAEIGTIMGSKRPATNQRLHRAKQKLKEIMKT